jgi:hypothetical protein
VSPHTPIPAKSTIALDRERLQRDLTTRPIAQLQALRSAVALCVIGTVGVGAVAAIVPAFVYPWHAFVSAIGIACSVVAALGSLLLAAHPVCRVIWGNHPILSAVVHKGAPLGMLAWACAFASMLVSRAANTVNSTAPSWLTSLASFSWWVYMPSLLAGLVGIACTSELLATVAREGQADDAAERLRFSFLALVAALCVGIVMWWSILTMWGGPGMIVAVGAGIFVAVFLARFASGFIPLLSLTKWAVINAEDLVGHEQRRLEQVAKRAVVLSEDQSPTAPQPPKQSEPWAKPVFKGSNTLKKNS